MSDYVIETKGLTKRYGGRVGVDRLDIHVPKGKIYGLLGRNGAGKTTLMKMLLNLAKPTGGSIFLFGRDVREAGKKTYYRIGSLIEAPGFYENLTAEENLRILARLRGQHRKDTTGHALSLVGLEEEADKIFRDCSLGMKQRLGIAAAIMHEPELLILDEPVNGLDPIGIHEIRTLLLKLCRENGTTILISSHILSEIERLADIIGVIHEGKLMEETGMDELQKRNRKYVSFEVSNVNQAALILERKYKIRDYVVAGGNLLRVFEGINSRADINSSFVEGGIAVANVSVFEETLEDYFARLTGGGKIG